MSAYREQAEQLEPARPCEHCGEDADNLHVCRAKGELLDRLMLSLGYRRRIVGLEGARRTEGDEEFRERVRVALRWPL